MNLEHVREGDRCRRCGEEWPCMVAYARHLIVDRARRVAAGESVPSITKAEAKELIRRRHTA